MRFVCLRGSAREAGVESNTKEPRDFSARVLWDVAQGGRGPQVRKGEISLERRSFLSRMAAAAMALAGLAVARAAHGASAFAGAEGDHSDSPHYDQTGKHTDITCDPPQCTESHHADGTPHSDRPHIDTNK